MCQRSDIVSILSVGPGQLLGAPGGERAAVEVPDGRGGSSVPVNADAVDAARRSQGGEGLADPAVLRLLEVVGQDSLLVLQLLYEEEHREGHVRSVAGKIGTLGHGEVISVYICATMLQKTSNIVCFFQKFGKYEFLEAIQQCEKKPPFILPIH